MINDKQTLEANMSRVTQKISFSVNALIISMLIMVAQNVSAQFDNLVAVDDSTLAAAFIDPDADFSLFKRVMILDTFVSFRSGWQRDQRSNRISARDMDRIKTRVSELFNSVLIETLESDDGFEVVSETDYDVLLIRAAIIDLDITAPQSTTGARTSSYTANSGAATLYIELYDSVSGQIIGRAMDRQSARQAGSMMRWTTRASNTADARRVFRDWAGALRGFLDSHYTGEQ
ncbi:MAG: DUF3313 family protein [Xanthomonadales bacterium]|nr:DUF3313 family protein [Xanthomonadales bacterium]